MFAAQFHRVARQTDDSLDEAFAIVGSIEDDDIAALRIGPLRQVPSGERNLEVVSQFVHEDEVTFDDGRLHRAGGDVIPVGE